MSDFRIAVTGTPGVGKTTFCSGSDFHVLTVEEIAGDHDCLGAIEDDGAAPIDLERLISTMTWPDENRILVDGHLSHLLPVDAIILIRCHPNTLRERLSNRDYAPSKVDENVECEFIGVISAECPDVPCLELDSAIGIDAMIAATERWITDGFKPHRPNEGIDWIGQLHGGD